MKKYVILLAAVAAIGFTACDTKKEKELAKDTSAATIDSLQQALTQSQNESSDLIETLSQIQDGFDQINEAEGRVSVASTAEGDRVDKEKIAESMSFIQRTLSLNRELIASLRQQLRASNQSDARTKAKLEDMVENFTRQLENKDKEMAELRKQLADKDIQIAEQGEQINSLNDNVSLLSEQNAAKERAMEQQDKELNTAYYVFGTKKELREQNILNRGDVLKSGSFNKDYFERIDLRVTKVIRLYSKSAKLMTTHPSGSYTLEKDAQGQYVLRITDPKAFWSVSRYLVITVK